MSKPRPQTFQVWADIKTTTTLPVQATSLEEALTKARELKTIDFIEIHGEHIDSELEITGVLK